MAHPKSLQVAVELDDLLERAVALFHDPQTPVPLQELKNGHHLLEVQHGLVEAQVQEAFVELQGQWTYIGL